MTNTSSNVVAPRPALAGGVYAAPLGTALPTDSTTALAAGYVAQGYIDKGVTEKIGRTTNEITAWGGDTVKIVQTKFGVSYDVGFLETLATGPNQLAWGADNVATTAPTISTGTLVSAKVTSETLPHQAFVFDMIDGLATIRIVVPNGQVTNIADVGYTDSGATIYTLTITAFPDASGVSAYKYMDDGVFS